jgi:hypothetical protein
MAFRDLRICNRDRWQLLHWRTLTSAYRRSPWFEFYEDSLKPLYEKKFEYLADWSLSAFELVNGWLGLSWDISFTDEYVKEYPERDIADMRGRILPRDDAGDFPSYRQVFQDRTGFIPGLSILDLIFCEGRKAVTFLTGFGQ